MEDLRTKILNVINSISPGKYITREQFLNMPHTYGTREINRWKRDRNRKLSEIDVLMASFVHEGLLETGFRRGAYKCWVKRHRNGI